MTLKHAHSSLAVAHREGFVNMKGGGYGCRWRMGNAGKGSRERCSVIMQDSRCEDCGGRVVVNVRC